MSNVTPTRRALVSCPSCNTLNRIDVGLVDNGPRCGSCSTSLRLDQPQPIPGEALDRIIGETDVPVVIDFYADWCGPCRFMAPVLDQFALDRAGEVLVGKLDTDRYPGEAVRFGIRGIPTLIVFSGGREVARQVGAVPRRTLDALLASVA
jgi:thioredoxin 2